jgi:hypothetical protein
MVVCFLFATTEENGLQMKPVMMWVQRRPVQSHQVVHMGFEGITFMAYFSKTRVFLLSISQVQVFVGFLRLLNMSRDEKERNKTTIPRH